METTNQTWAIDDPEAARENELQDQAEFLRNQCPTVEDYCVFGSPISVSAPLLLPTVTLVVVCIILSVLMIAGVL